VNKKEKKLRDKKCIFCEESNYSLLDCHRLTPGSKYTEKGTLVVCSNCHRRIHSGKIKIISRHPTTKGCDVLIYINEEGKEQIKEI
jgi:hypothetical protein